MKARALEAAAVLAGIGGSLARSGAALIEAEVEQLRFDLGQSWARVVRLALLWGIVVGVAFWGVGALLFAAGAGLALVLPVWAAALVVAGALGVATVVLLVAVRRQLRRLESPARTVRRRVGSHFAFWRDLLLQTDDQANGGQANGGRATGGPGEGDAPADDGDGGREPG